MISLDIDDQLELIYQMIDKAVKAAIADAAPRWIPVEERLPDDETKVICYPEYYKVHYENGDWWSGNYRIIYGVTHWQPLPEPPAD